MRRNLATVAALVVTCAIAAACGALDSPQPLASPTATVVPRTPTATPVQGQLLYAVGDIADCASEGDEVVAALLAASDAPIAALGDIVYEVATTAEFANCFEPAWGPMKARIRPAVGNHDYGRGQADDYYAYFGEAAGPPRLGYYSWDYAGWHVIVLNSVCDFVPGGCGVGSPQHQWLVADLAAHPATCTLAYYHHPRFTSGLHGGIAAMDALWQTLAAAGVDVALAAHDHHYERFVPLDAAGNRDEANGIRSFIVGTGGGTLFPVLAIHPNSVVRDTRTFGALELTLGKGAYAWRFLPARGKTFTDAGSGKCH